MKTTGVVTVTEAARLLGLDVATVRRRLARGDMQGVKAGPRAWLIEHTEIERQRQLGRLKPGPKPHGTKE